MEQLGTCFWSKVPHELDACVQTESLACSAWQPVPAEPAEYTCPRCESNVSTHICMKAEPVAGETKQCSCCGAFNPEYTHPCGESYCWHCEDNRGRHDDCEKCHPAPAVAAPAEGKRWQLKLDGCSWEEKARRTLAMFADVIKHSEYGFEDQEADDKICELTAVAESLVASTPPTADPAKLRFVEWYAKWPKGRPTSDGLTVPEIIEAAEAYARYINGRS